MTCFGINLHRVFVTLVAFAIIAPALSFNTPTAAQETATEEETAEETSADETEETESDDASAEELFTVPEGDAATLQEYIKKLANTPPKGETDEEQVQFSLKALNALVTAAERMLAAKPDESQTVQGHGFRIQALQALVAMGQEDAREKLETAMTEARAHADENILGMGWQALIGDRTGRWPQLDPKDQQAFLDEIVAKVETDGPQEIDASIVQVAAMQLDGTDDPFVVKLLEAAVPHFAKSEDPTILASLKESNLEGMLRRLKLPGNEIEITGELLSGDEVDWKSYRGKVVLVDFWATWCGPCRAEVPNILAMYEAYHEKGFDVLGVSLDETPEAAQKYKAEMKLPWDSLFPKSEDDRGWNNPLARHYGIGGIPTAILVDKDGKVVHMNARGELLQEELKRLLGEPAEKKPAAEKEAEKEADKDAEKPS